jgi:hypothetical protein
MQPMGLAPALPHPTRAAAVVWPAWLGAAQARSGPACCIFVSSKTLFVFRRVDNLLFKINPK